jgi:hypothetical protein
MALTYQLSLFPLHLLIASKRAASQELGRKITFHCHTPPVTNHQLILSRMLVTKMKTDKISKQGIYKCEHQPTAQDQKQD